MTPPPGAVGIAPSQGTLPLAQGTGQVLHPTGGLTASPPTAPPPAPAGAPGQIPLADLLSHGVEQPPAEGLSLAPEASSVPPSIPFRHDPGFNAGELTLGDQFGPAAVAERHPDLAGVMSQGVPEGIVQRTANNASGESAASQEAINRGTRPLVVIDQDGNEEPVLRDVTQADRRAPKGKIILDKSTGEIIDRGNMSQSACQWLCAIDGRLMDRPLGASF